MRYRGQQVSLPTENPTARKIWETLLIAAASSDIVFLDQLCSHCMDQGLLQERLFFDVVGSLLRHQPDHASRFASKLLTYGSQGREDLLNLFDIACASTSKSAMLAFRDVKLLFPDARIYKEVVSNLHKMDRADDALAMHTFLLSQQDLPASFSDLIPFIEHFATTGLSIDRFLNRLRAAGACFNAQARRLYARERARQVGFHPEAMNIVASHTFGRMPIKLRDETVAQALASFSFNFVLKVGPPFGLIEVGPLSIRQLALASKDASELNARFRQLQEVDIDTGSSAYVRIMKRVAASQQTELVKLLAQTDMHHEEFEERDLQTTLLDQGLRKRNLHDINRSLVIIAGGETTSQTRTKAANSLLRSAVNNNDHKAILQVVELFRLEGCEIEASVTQHLLGFSNPVNGDLVIKDSDQPAFLIGVLQQLLVTGAAIPPGIWVELLVDLGRHGRLTEVEHLLLWLTKFYGQHHSDASIRDHTRLLNDLFTIKLRYALVSWSFTKQDWTPYLSGRGKRPMADSVEPWLRGAAFLKRMRDRYGVWIDVPRLQEAFVKRVQTLYGPRTYSRLSANKACAIAHGVRPESLLESWSRLWGIKMSKDKQEELVASVRHGVRHSKGRTLRPVYTGTGQIDSNP